MASIQIDNRQRIGMWGAMILFIGGFTPVFPLSFGYDSCSYFQQDFTTIFLLLIVIPSGCWLLVYFKKYKVLKIFGYLLLAWHLLILSFWPSFVLESQPRNNFELGDNSLDNLSESLDKFSEAMGSFSHQIQWGWVVLFAGSLLIVYCSLMKESPTDVSKS